MATYLDGNVRKATANTVAAMKRNALANQCPKCGRKSALIRLDDMIVCRWSERKLCDYVRLPTRRYKDWFDALGHEIPDGNRAACRDWLVSQGCDAKAANAAVQGAANWIEEDQPEVALRHMRALLGSAEMAVIRAMAYLCCPPYPATPSPGAASHCHAR